MEDAVDADDLGDVGDQLSATDLDEGSDTGSVVDGDIDGFFGIWEQASHDPHFELRRGGHSRLLPGDLTSTRAHRVHVRLESGLDYDYERERDRL